MIYDRILIKTSPKEALGYRVHLASSIILVFFERKIYINNEELTFDVLK